MSLRLRPRLWDGDRVSKRAMCEGLDLETFEVVMVLEIFEVVSWLTVLV